MIKVELYLNDAQEREWFGELMNAIDHWRAAHTVKVAEATQAAVGGEVSDETQGVDPANPPADVIAHIEPDPNSTEPTVTKPELAAPPKVEYADLEKIVLAYLQKHGVSETREKIAAYGYPKLDQVPAEKWAELKALFEGWLAE